MSSLVEFSRGHRTAPEPLSSRVAAAALTAGLYALLIFLGGHRTAWTNPRPPLREIYTSVMPVVEEKKPLPRLAEFVTHLIRPRAQAISPPPFIVATETPPPQDSLSPAQSSSLTSSSLTSGAPQGTANGQGGMANGVNGNGNTLSACYDAAWAQSVTDRVRKFFYYPPDARARKLTGTVVLHIVVRSNGRLSFLKIAKSSGEKSLDEAALDMTRRAQPLPRIPDRMHAARVDALFPITFGEMDKSFKASEGDCGVDANHLFNRDT